jgi:hypothetical protein
MVPWASCPMAGLRLRLALGMVVLSLSSARGQPFQIQVVDDQTGRGVPLVELKTVHQLRYLTDSNGLVAFDEPGLMEQTVFFHIQSHGYEFPKDGFGYRGKALKVTKGGHARLAIQRINIAERLYRVTGAGIYHDSVRVGHPVPIRHPVLNAQVLGSDSVVNALGHGRLYWFWGDTNRPSYPLGNFHVPGATSQLPAQGGLDPERGVDLDYFLDADGFAKETCPMPGPGPTWISGLVTLRDASGRERMFAHYVKIRNLLEAYERGLVEFDAEAKQFQKVATFPIDAPVQPGGHPLLKREDGVEWVYFAMPYPLLRVRADVESFKDLDAYEAFTCLKAGTRPDHGALDRDGRGRLRYAWKRNAPVLSPTEEAKLIEKGPLKRAESLFPLQDAETGKPIIAHAGSVFWNEYRQRWVMVTVEMFGTSMLGEVWYAEADTLLGPWVYARKIVTHDKYSFYNPKQHPYFAKENGRVIFFEGTYASTFSGNPDPTPRYDYNQIMYKLDLSDPRLGLPVPIYRLSEHATAPALGDALRVGPRRAGRPIAFFALDRPRPGAVPVFEAKDEQGGRGLRLGRVEEAQAKQGAPAPLFFALPPDTKQPPATAIPLFEFKAGPGQDRAYSTDPSWHAPGYQKADRPLALVWRNPMPAPIPETTGPARD